MDNDYTLTNIMNIYHDEQYEYGQLYRYVKVEEIKALISKKEIKFARPSFWAKVDKHENYFEEWWMNQNNLEEWLEYFIEMCEKHYAMSGIDVDEIWQKLAVVFIDKICCLNPMSFCYCLTEDWKSSKKEHNEKWEKDVLICYKKDFWEKISILNKKICLSGDYLFADIFPMYYIGDFEEYIERCFFAFNRDQAIELIINKGSFLKHDRYMEEKEVRIKLAYKIDEYYRNYNAPELAMRTILVKERKEFITICLEYMSSAREFYRRKLENIPNIKSDGYFYLNLPSDILLKDIIDCIKLGKNISDDDKVTIIELAESENIIYEENVF